MDEYQINQDHELEYAKPQNSSDCEYLDPEDTQLNSQFACFEEELLFIEKKETVRQNELINKQLNVITRKQRNVNTVAGKKISKSKARILRKKNIKINMFSGMKNFINYQIDLSHTDCPRTLKHSFLRSEHYLNRLLN
eukprot:TRINITY_DN9128_c0_g1_i10.p1 TRINITY_DN9128_c0_g1~~TRINITY_DN9128_c0_g1_i10.p1  ORF type:complete len:138 (+),score=19.01 TRINITY_DN9128_c0_g1_i10:350-763(+)